MDSANHENLLLLKISRYTAAILTISFYLINLRSIFAMVTVASSGIPTLTPEGKDGSIVSIKYSSPSNMTSSIIGISNETIVSPAGNVTMYGPEP